MIYVTHDQVEAMTLGDRIAVMNRGRLQQLGRPTRSTGTPVQPVRGQLHRQPGDEHPARRRSSAGAADVTAGVRPEALQRAGDGAGGIALELGRRGGRAAGKRRVRPRQRRRARPSSRGLPGNVRVSPGDRVRARVRPAPTCTSSTRPERASRLKTGSDPVYSGAMAPGRRAARRGRGRTGRPRARGVGRAGAERQRAARRGQSAPRSSATTIPARKASPLPTG